MNGVANKVEVVNGGSIAATSATGIGVELLLNGTIINSASASIVGGARGVHLNGGAGTVVNYGSIGGRRYAGVVMFAGGSVTNASSGTITGSHGVAVSGGAQVNALLVNAGSIVGYEGTAVTFSGTGSNLLVLVPGFGFSGSVDGGTSGSSALELASAVSAGTLTGLGSQFLRFNSIAFDAGAQWSIAGLQRGLDGPISGFAAGDTIELDGVTVTGSSFADGVLTLNEAVGFATLDLPGPFTLASFDVTDDPRGPK